MAEFKPTAAQKAAIETRGSTVLVSAGAGSGKTRVLTERLMGYITDPVAPADLDSFLIISFTRAAAGELRGRIMEELSSRLAAEPTNRRLRRQSALCARAQIGTIHSFCASLLRQHCHLAGLSPDFKILDEDRAESMKRSALERVLEERYEKDGDEDFRLLADTVGAGRDDKRLAEMVLSLHEKIQCHARPEKWAAEQAELLSRPLSDAGESLWGQEIIAASLRSLSYWRRELESLVEAMAAQEKIAKAYMPAVSAAAEYLAALEDRSKLGWDALREALPVPFGRLGALRASPDPVLSERVKGRWNACKKAMASLEATFASPSEKLLADTAKSAPAMKALLRLTLDFDSAYTKDKRRSSLVDYADLEHLAARLLTNEDGSASPLALSLSESYTEVMVDEYQDVSQVQDSIFHAVSGNGKKLFLVGDVKQSIYRFRLADPGIFTDKYLRFADYDKAVPGQPRRILLQENFRSRKEVIDCANAVFSHCMSRELGDIDYDENAALRCAARYPGEAEIPELILMELPESSDEEESPDKLSLEAAMVGEKILELMDKGIFVSGRPLEFGDIAILMRSANTVGAVYRRELSALGIPVSAGQSKDYFSSVEISMLMCMLALVDDPHQDIALIAVLRAPALGLSADELSMIRAKDRRGDFYSALKLAAEENEKLSAFLSQLSALRALAADMSMDELIWEIINRFDLLAICSAMSEGAVRRRRITEFLELAGRFEATGYRGLHRFVLWLRQLSERGAEPGGGAGERAVQIMTVHKSKGLEFPVVFLSDTARRFNRQDSRDNVLVHPKLGLGARFTDLTRRIEYPTLARNAIKLRLEREMLSEEMRLLYVALTRAREYLYITAAVKDASGLLEKSEAAIAGPLEPELLASASSPANWLVFAALADGERHLRIRHALPPRTVEQESGAAEAVQADEEALSRLEKNLAFRYPHDVAQTLPSKLTATELKGRREQDEDADEMLIAPAKKRWFTMPDLLSSQKPLSGAKRGTATHLALQYLDYGKTGSIEEIEREVERLCQSAFISQREAEAVDCAAIRELFRSELGQRMKNAQELRREFKFSLLCSARELLGAEADEELLLQGVVDCCMVEDGKLVIVDYKTDRIHSQVELEEKTRLYTPQLRAYAAALGRIFDMEVKECVLYFLSVGKLSQITEKDLQ